MSTSRREFFTYTGATTIGAAMAAGLGAGVLPLAAGAAPAAGKVKFRVSGRTGTIGKRGPEALAFAKELGLEGVEIEAHDGREIGESLDCMNADAQKRYLDEAQKTGVAVSSVCMGHMNSYPVWDDPRAKAWIEGTIDATAALGAKHILVPFFGKADLRAQGSDRPDAAKREKTLAVLKACAPRAEAKGVALCIESYLEASDAKALAQAVGSPAVRVYYDFGNSSVRGYDVPKEIRTLGKDYLAIVHFKNHDDLLGRGDKIDMAAVKQAMTDIGYEGWIVLETSGKPLGPERSAVYNTAFIRGLFC